MQIPTRDLSSTLSMIYARCSNLNPRLEPCPAVFSMTAVTPLRAVEGDIDRLGDAVQALLRRNSVQVAARMEIKTVEAEGLAAAHFVDEGRPGLLEPFALGMPQVDQVTVVRQDAPGHVTPGPAILSESRDLGRRQGRCAPLTLVFGKRAKPVAPILCAFKGAFSGPPAALTCAPKYFILFALSYYLSFC